MGASHSPSAGFPPGTSPVMPLEWPAMVIVFTANPLVPNPEDSNPYPTGTPSLVHFLSAPPRAPPQLFGAAITPGPWLREWFVGAAAPFPKPRDGRDSAIPRRSPPALTLEYFTTSNFNKARKCKREGACLHMPPTLLTNHRPVCAHRMAHHGDYGHRRPAVAETGAPPPTQKPLPAGENNARSSLLPSSVSLSHSLSFGRAGRHHFGSTSRRLRQDMISQPVEGRLPIPPPPPFFRPCTPAVFLAFLISTSLPLSFPSFGRGKRAFFGFPPERWRPNVSSHRYRRKKEKCP